MGLRAILGGYVQSQMHLLKETINVWEFYGFFMAMGPFLGFRVWSTRHYLWR
jgi:hypothetical protein